MTVTSKLKEMEIAIEKFLVAELKFGIVNIYPDVSDEDLESLVTNLVEFMSTAPPDEESAQCDIDYYNGVSDLISQNLADIASKLNLTVEELTAKNLLIKEVIESADAKTGVFLQEQYGSELALLTPQ
jgi:hypothetical protein